MSSKPTILLIDDDPSFLRATALALSDNFNIIPISDPREAPRYFASCQAVVSDYKMQFGNGCDILRQCQISHPATPVILVTAYATKEIAMTALNHHAFAIIEKPVDLNQLKETLHKACSRGRNQPPATYVRLEIALNSDELSATAVGENSVRLTVTEFKILEIFLNSPNKPFHRDALIEVIWGCSKLTGNVLDTHLFNLKKKIPLFNSRFKLVRGRGYIYAE